MASVSQRLITSKSMIESKALQRWTADENTKAGETLAVATVIGQVRGWQIKESTLPDGTLSRSIVLLGGFMFIAEHKGRGVEVGDRVEGSSIIIPGSWPEAFSLEFNAIRKKMPDFNPMIVVSIAVEATGKAIPYAWVARSEMARVIDPFKSMLDIARNAGIKNIPAPAVVLTTEQIAAIRDSSFDVSDETKALEASESLEDAIKRDALTDDAVSDSDRAKKPAPKK